MACRCPRFVAAAPRAATAQADFPRRAVKFVVPVPPGNMLDSMPRIIGEKLSARWNQPVIVENRPGAASNLGAEAVFEIGARRLHAPRIAAGTAGR